MNPHIFQPEAIKPIALVEENVGVFDGSDWKYFKVTYIEAQQPFIKNFGVISAGKSTGDTAVDEVKVGKGWLGIYRVKPIEDLEVTVKQPKAATRFVVSALVTSVLSRLNQLLGMEHLAELAVWEDKVPLFDVKNPTGYDLPMSRVVFYGFKFKIESIAKPDRWAAVEAAGRGE